jgi:hypothetical protein
MRQTWLMSLIEALATGVAGYGTAVAATMLVFSLIGLHTSLRNNLAIGAIFTSLSLARSFLQVLRMTTSQSNVVLCL